MSGRPVRGEPEPAQPRRVARWAVLRAFSHPRSVANRDGCVVRRRAGGATPTAPRASERTGAVSWKARGDSAGGSAAREEGVEQRDEQLAGGVMAALAVCSDRLAGDAERPGSKFGVATGDVERIEGGPGGGRTPTQDACGQPNRRKERVRARIVWRGIDADTIRLGRCEIERAAGCETKHRQRSIDEECHGASPGAQRRRERRDKFVGIGRHGHHAATRFKHPHVGGGIGAAVCGDARVGQSGGRGGTNGECAPRDAGWRAEGHATTMPAAAWRLGRRGSVSATLRVCWHETRECWRSSRSAEAAVVLLHARTPAATARDRFFARTTPLREYV